MFSSPFVSYQDRVPTFTATKAKNLIEKDLGTPINVLFKEFEDLPLAAASLGQVLAFSLFISLSLSLSLSPIF